MKKLLALLMLVTAAKAAIPSAQLSSLTEMTNAPGASNLLYIVDLSLPVNDRARKIQFSKLTSNLQQAISVNGTNQTVLNFTNGGNIIWAVVGSNITATITNVAILGSNFVLNLDGHATNLTLVTPKNAEFTNIFGHSVGADTVTVGNSLISSGTPFRRDGVVFAGTEDQENAVWEVSILPDEANPQYYTNEATVWKMWHTVGWGPGVNIGYAESTNQGTTWTRVTTNTLSGFARSHVYKDSTNYVMHATPLANETNICRFTTTDYGLTWSMANSNVFGINTNGAWDDALVGNSFVYKKAAAQYFLFYDAYDTAETQWNTGLATNATGVPPWNRVGTNYVIGDGMGGAWVTNVTINGTPTWVALVHGPPSAGAITPTDIYVYTTTSTIPTDFTRVGRYPALARASLEEGAFAALGQVADSFVVVDSAGRINLFYEAGPDGATFGSQFDILRAHTDVGWTNFLEAVGQPDQIKLSGQGNFTELQLFGYYPLRTRPLDYTTGTVLEGGIYNDNNGIWRVGYNQPNTTLSNDYTFAGGAISFETRAGYDPINFTTRAAGSSAFGFYTASLDTNGVWKTAATIATNWVRFLDSGSGGLTIETNSIYLFADTNNNRLWFKDEVQSRHRIVEVDSSVWPPSNGQTLRYNSANDSFYPDVYGGGAGTNASIIYYNAASVNSPNFVDTTNVLYTVGSSTNITVSITNLGNANIATGAAIAKSKISTASTWADADLPSTATLDSEWNTIAEIEAATGVDIVTGIELNPNQFGTNNSNVYIKSGSFQTNVINLDAWTSATTNINWGASSTYYWFMTNNVTFTFSSVVDGMTVKLFLENDAIGGYSITLPAGVIFLSPTNAPTATAATPDTNALAINRGTLFRRNGTNYFEGWYVKDNTTLTEFAALGDPGADRIYFWDESDNAPRFLAIGSGLSISGGTTLTASVSGTAVYENGSSVSNPNFQDSTGIVLDTTSSTNIQFQIASGASATNLNLVTPKNATFTNLTVSGTATISAGTITNLTVPGTLTATTFDVTDLNVNQQIITNGAIFSGFLVLAGDLRPSQITADQNNYNPSGLTNATMLYLTSDASRTITGLQSDGTERHLSILNVGSQNILLADDSASSAASNRFAFSAAGGGSVTLLPDQTVSGIYDTNSLRWRFLSIPDTTGSSFIDDTAFASSWNGVTTIAPSKNVVYDWGHTFDTDDDGKVDVIDVISTAGLMAVNSSGVPVQGRTITESTGIDVTNGDGASGNPTIAVDLTEINNYTQGDGTQTSVTNTVNVSAGVDPVVIYTDSVVNFSNVGIKEGGNDVYNSSETPGGELNGTWANPLIDDGVTVGDWVIVGLTVGEDFALSGDLAPAELTADQNNYSPTGFGTSTIIKLTADASRNITGLQVSAGWDGVLKTLYNGEPIGSTTNITLVTASTSSATTNRFSFAQDIILGPGDAVTVRYDATDSRWLMHSRGPISIMNFAQFYTGDVVATNGVVAATGQFTNTLAAYSAAFTNSATLNGAGLKTNRVGVVRSIDVPLNMFYTNGVATSVAASAIWTNAAGVSWTFADGATNTTRLTMSLPVEWGAGTVRWRFEMGSSLTNNTSNTNVVFGLKAGSVGNGETWTNITFGTQITFTNHIHKSPYRTVTCVTPDLTVGNTPAVNKPIVWELTRLNADGADVNTNTIAIVNAQLFYTETQTEPSMPAVTN